MHDGSVDLVVEGEVARVVINRPSMRNALSLSMWRAIRDVLRRIRATPAVQPVVVQGQGNEAFSAGADIGELEALIGSRAAGLDYIDAIHGAEDALGMFELPTVACIRGFCVGGGLELAMACDLRFATDDSRFMAPPARLGIVYSVSSTRRLCMLVGESGAKELLFSAREIDAGEAIRIGLVNQIFTPESFDEEFASRIEKMLRNSQRSIRNVKLIFDAIRSGAIVDPPEVRELRVSGFGEADFAEGVDAFRSRRHSNFTWGRAQSC